MNDGSSKFDQKGVILKNFLCIGRNLSEYGISCASGGLKSTSINMKKKVVFIYISILYNIPENLNAKSFFV